MNDETILTQEGKWVYKLNLPFKPSILIYDYEIDRVIFELNIAKRHFEEAKKEQGK